MAADAVRLFTKKRQDQRKVVRAQIEDHRLGGTDPSHGKPVCRHMPKLADDARRQLVLKFKKGVVIPDQVTDHELAVCRGGGGGHRFRFDKAHSQRLFDIDMLAGGESLAGEFGMCWRGGCDDDAIKIGFADQICHWQCRCLKLRGKAFSLRGNGIRDAPKNAELRQIARQIPAPHAASNQSNACHCRLSQNDETAFW